ncbi:MAG: hypothetical protein HZC50_09655 [Nitrospirae bacterium]|nr:hypothetical protein [Nitrospirota bacterium]
MAENRELALVLRLVADDFKKELQSSKGALSGFNDFIKDWRTQLTAAGTALFAVAKSTANYADGLVDMGHRLGTTVQETARLQHAAKLADTDLNGLAVVTGFLSKNMLEAARGNQEARQAFSQLGVTVTTTSGNLKGTTDILLELSDRFRLMPEGPEKIALAMAVMGKSAKDVLPLMNSNLREAFQETKELGLEMSTHAAKAASEFNDQLDKLKGAVQGVGNNIGEVLIPQFTSLTKILTTITTDAGSAMRALLSLDKAEAPQVGVVQPDGGGRRLRVMPAPSEDIAKQFQTQPFFKTPEQAAADQERLAKERERLKKEKEARGREEERKGTALREIFLSQNRALDIRNKLMGGQGELSEYFLAFDRQEQFRKENEAEQVRQGQAIAQRTQFEVQLRDRAATSERESLIKNTQAWIDYDNQVGASTELRYDHQMDLLRANLSKETQLTQEESGRLLIAWQNHDTQLKNDILNRTQLFGLDRETLERQYLTKLVALNQQYSGDVFAGWKKGLEDYVRNTDSAFGFAAQMAQRTAQFMEQNFRTFFFDVMDGKIKSMKDLFLSFGNFVKQIIAQIMAQLAVALVMKGLTSAFGGGGAMLGGLFSEGGPLGGGGFGAAKFASGGMVLGAGNQDTVRAMLMPGEGVLNRRGVQALGQLNAGGRCRPRVNRILPSIFIISD